MSKFTRIDLRNNPRQFLPFFRLFLIHYSTQTTYKDVANDNGMIAFKIENVRIKLGYERIIKKISLGTIEMNINHIEKIASSFKIRDHLHETLMRKIVIAREKVRSLQPHRQKRGLINALGTVLKYIAGNPDQEDLQIIQQSIGTLQTRENELTNNQMKQIKINNNFQNRINNVTNTLRKISSQISLINNTLRQDAIVEHMNLIFSTDLLIHALEDLEEQIEFSRQNLLSKNILSLEDKEYIFQKLIRQDLKLQFIDEIFLYSSGSITISKDNVVILVKIPILDDNLYELLELQTLNINHTKISTDIQWVAKNQNRIIPQHSKCKICDDSLTLEDECIYKILTHQKPKCSMIKTERQTRIKEIMRGIIFIDTKTKLEVFSSCGDSRVVSEPTVIETENCTINVLNYTFHSEEQFKLKQEYLVPTYNKQPETVNDVYDEPEELKIDNLKFLEEVQLYQRTTVVGGTTIILTIIIISFLFLVIIIRKNKSKQAKDITKKPLDDSGNEEVETAEGKPRAIRFIKLPALSSLSSQPRTVNNLGREEL